MIAMCKQMTYTDDELREAPTVELERTLAAIKQVRDELIGTFWPLVLDKQRQAITNELAKREKVKGGKVNYVENELSTQKS